MTIQELKNHVAIKLGYVGWHEIIDDHKLSDEIVDILLTEQLSKLGIMQGLPIDFIIHATGTNERIVYAMYNEWLQKQGSTAVGKEREEKGVSDWEEGYSKGYADATREACDEIAENYKPAR